jgi:D-xylulose 5-phosphate/D-fructose 6-phosphate phosphoketolase
VDQNLAADGRVMELLSEHTCQGWLEGYLLTGRPGTCSARSFPGRPGSAQPPQKRILRLGRAYPDPGIHPAHPVVSDNHRVEVELRR